MVHEDHEKFPRFIFYSWDIAICAKYVRVGRSATRHVYVKRLMSYMTMTLSFSSHKNKLNLIKRKLPRSKMRALVTML